MKKEKVKPGTTIGELLDDLARRYPAIAENVFDTQKQRLFPQVVLNYNDRVINPHIAHNQVLNDGDKICIFPIYTGG